MNYDLMMGEVQNQIVSAVSNACAWDLAHGVKKAKRCVKSAIV